MLQVEDRRIDELVAQLTALNGTSEAEVVLGALQREWARAKASMQEKLKPLQEFVANHGKSGLTVDKAFFDDLSGE